MSKKPLISVIVTATDEWSELKKTLWSLENQLFRSFDIYVVSDAGLDHTDRIASFNRDTSRPIHYSFNRDEEPGGLVDLINSVLTTVKSDYIFTTNAGCILREDVLQAHFERREKGYYLSGGSYLINQQVFNAITYESIATQEGFSSQWLTQNGMTDSYRDQKLSTHFVLSRLMEHLTPTRPAWYGNNASGWKANLLSVKGFDTRYHKYNYDLDLGIRLQNSGIKPRQIRYSAMCLQLPRDYAALPQESLERNRILLEEVIQSKDSKTKYGLQLTVS
ncbi:MAG: glycosyltransferase [Nonlabens sp.]